MLDLERAIEYGERAVAIASEIHDTTVAVLANTFLGLARYSMGEFAAAIALSRRNIALLHGSLARERFGMALFPAVYSRTVLTWSLAELGNFAEAAEVGREAVQIAETVDHPYTLVFACLGCGTVHLRRGDLPEAIATLERAVRTCRTGDVPVIFALAASPLGSAYCLTGKAEAALDLLKEAIEQAIAIGDPFGHWLRAAGQRRSLPPHGTSWRSAPAGQARSRNQQGGQGSRGHGLGPPPEGRGRRSDPPLVDEAEAAYRDALTMAHEMGMRPLAARCRLGLGLCTSKPPGRKRRAPRSPRPSRSSVPLGCRRGSPAPRRGAREVAEPRSPKMSSTCNSSHCSPDAFGVRVPPEAQPPHHP